MKVSHAGLISLVIASVTVIVGAVTWLSGHFQAIEGRLAELETSITATIDDHEEFLSVEHGDINRSIATAQDDFRSELGFHRGQHYHGDHFVIGAGEQDCAQ